MPVQSTFVEVCVLRQGPGVHARVLTIKPSLVSYHAAGGGRRVTNYTHKQMDVNAWRTNTFALKFISNHTNAKYIIIMVITFLDAAKKISTVFHRSHRRVLLLFKVKSFLLLCLPTKIRQTNLPWYLSQWWRKLYSCLLQVNTRSEQKTIGHNLLTDSLSRAYKRSNKPNHCYRCELRNAAITPTHMRAISLRLI